MVVIDFIVSFIAVIIAFIAGMACSNVNRRGNFLPIDRKEYDERWIGEPPPFHIAGTVAEKPPTTVIHLHAPWMKAKD